MRILFLAPQPFYQERGTPIAVKLALETLAHAGHSVDLLTYPGGSDLPIAGVTVTRVGPPFFRRVPVGFSWRKLLFGLWLLWHARQRVRQARYDAIHAVEEAVFVGAWLKPTSGARLVYDMDSSMVEQLVRKFFWLKPFRPALDACKRWALRRCDLILPVCPALAERVRELGAQAPVVLLHDVAEEPPSAAPAEDLRATLAPGSLLVLYVGNLEPYQGIDLFLEAVARAYSAPSFTAVLIGGTQGHIARYQRLATRLEIQNRVRFLGPRPLEALPNYLRQADVLVSPRRGGTNTPMKFYAYMLSGKAILATDVPAHRQVVDETAAWLAAPEPDAFAEGLVRLLRHPALRARLGARAREIALTNYGRAHYDQQLLSAYALLAGKEKP